MDTVVPLPIRKPRNLAQATALCERFSGLQAQIEAINAVRVKAIAEANAAADAEAQDLIAERDAIGEKLGAWWPDAAAEVLPKGRKSVELGGCMIGSVTSRTHLTLSGDEEAVIGAMKALRWAKPFLRSVVTIERAGVLKALDGSRAKALADLGFEKGGGTETFFVKRAQQQGTRA